MVVLGGVVVVSMRRECADFWAAPRPTASDSLLGRPPGTERHLGIVGCGLRLFPFSLDTPPTHSRG